MMDWFIVEIGWLIGDTKHQTSLSDVETETTETTDKLYYIKYGTLTVATVRPETIFGDVAVAVNPRQKIHKFDKCQD